MSLSPRKVDQIMSWNSVKYQDKALAPEDAPEFEDVKGERQLGRPPEEALNRSLPLTERVRMWAAGVFTYKGSFKRLSNRPNLVLEEWDDVPDRESPELNRLVKHFGGRIEKAMIEHQYANHKRFITRKRYKLHGQRAVELYDSIKPYLSERRRMAIENGFLPEQRPKRTAV